MNWDYIKTFETVAKHGGLSVAARQLGISPATAGRHISALEHQLGQLLFDRLPDGYALTSAGVEFLPFAKQMSETASRLERKKTALEGKDRGVVRIAGGNWISKLLLNNLYSLREALPHAEFEIINAYQFANLARHDADIALRNQRPEKGRVAVRRLPEMLFAVYASKTYADNHPKSMSEERYKKCQWVGYDAHLASLPSARWLAERRKKMPEIRCVQAINILDGVLGNLGLGLLPCCIGEAEENLVRVSERYKIEGSDVWMLIHEDLRQVPVVRQTADWIADTFIKIVR